MRLPTPFRILYSRRHDRLGRHHLAIDHPEQIAVAPWPGKYNPGDDTTQIIEEIDAEIRRLQIAKARLDGSGTISGPAAKTSPKKTG
jgi:hypothetical protein